MTRGHQVRDYLSDKGFYTNFFFGLPNGKTGGNGGAKRVPYKFIEGVVMHGDNPDAVLMRVGIYSHDLATRVDTRTFSLGRHLDDVVYNLKKQKSGRRERRHNLGEEEEESL